MRSLPVLSLVAASASAGHLAVSFSKVKVNSALSVIRRDNTINLEAINNVTGGGYYSEFEVGTPGQKVSFLLDTGSSDTWVNSVDADLCNSQTLQQTNGYCMATFNPDDSSTFQEVDSNGLDITYLDGRNIKGDYFNDTVTIEGQAIRNQQLGLALESVRPTGIMGLGFRANVAADREYPTVIDNMVSQGVIDTAAFSLYLNDIDSNSGTILFGGIDAQKFIGDLATLPLKSDFQTLDGNITSFTVAMEGFEVSAPSGSGLKLDSLNADAILDSGSTLCLLPDDHVQDLWDEFGVKSIQGLQVPFIDCAYRGSKGDDYSFDFKFKGKTISVPMSEMVINAFEEIQDAITDDATLSQLFDGWDGACMFGIASASDYGVDTDDFALLGDTFLRSAYVVYDLANEQIALAQANLRSNDSDITELLANSTTIPAIKGVPRQSPFSESSSSAATVTAASSSASATASGTTATGAITTTVTNGSPEATSSDSDDDSAAGHLVPAVALSLLSAVAAGMALL